MDNTFIKPNSEPNWCNDFYRGWDYSALGLGSKIHDLI